MTIDWDAVNQEIDGKVFTVDGFTMPRGSVVIDNRLNVPIIIKRVGDEPFPPTVDNQDIPTARVGIWRWILGAILALLVGAIGVWHTYRKRRTSNSTTQ
jgi:hypothetical protein